MCPLGVFTWSDPVPRVVIWLVVPGCSFCISLFWASEVENFLVSITVGVYLHEICSVFM
uniref:Uncharacterized protein n=1 Tax=Arundo donax TaxID=35708 RepID=A0A0A9AWA1_ARUDO